MGHVGKTVTQNIVSGSEITDGTVTGDDLASDIAISTSGNISTTGDLTVDSGTLFVDASENKVGIGTTTVRNNLDFGVTSNNDHIIALRDNNVSRTILGLTNGYGVRVGSPSDGTSTENMFEVGEISASDGTTYQNTRFAVAYSGHVGIGGTPDNSYQFCVKETGAGVGIKLEPTGTSCESYIQLKFQNTSNTTRTGMIKGDNGDTLRIASSDAIGIGMETSDSQALGIGSDGSLRLQHVYDDTTSNSANMYIHSDGTHQVMRSTSSERYKKNIETLEDKYADAVLGLRPVWYKSKCEADNPDYSHWGLIAEEVAKVDPRLVTFRNEYTEDIGDGKYKVVKLDAPQAESVQYDRLVPHLINICKRQEDKITALEARIKALEEA
jgi:hypothetical protein